jgi:protoporphyrinogen oxidase
VRLAGTILYASRIRDWLPLEQVSVSDWLRRLSGKRTFERIWLPLLRSKLGDNYRLARAAFIWAIIARMYAARRSGLKREMFGYVEGGYHTILQAFRSRLEQLGVQTRCGRPVRRVHDRNNCVEVSLEGGESYTFDQAVLTVPCSQVVALCPDLSMAERERLESVVYQGIVCASLLLRKPLAGYYITNITESSIPFTGVIEMTALVDPAGFGGNSLVYLPRYLTQDDELWHKSDAEVLKLFVAALERMYPQFDPSDVLASQVARVREMLAVSTLRYSERSRPPLRTSLPNVYLVNSAQIANGTLNVNETVGLANESARELRSVMSADAPDPALSLP